MRPSPHLQIVLWLLIYSIFQLWQAGGNGSVAVSAKYIPNHEEVMRRDLGRIMLFAYFEFIWILPAIPNCKDLNGVFRHCVKQEIITDNFDSNTFNIGGTSYEGNLDSCFAASMKRALSFLL